MSINIKKKSYLPSIDGLRALAIIFVLAYHFQVPFLQGGFIGVDIFFVLSGYLITSTLLREWVTNKEFNIKTFWLKRVRRLLPAVILLLIVVLLFCFFFFPASFKQSWPDSLAALFYVSNWWYIFQKIPYFESFGTPSPFKHLWSLAIEEQFYLLWPVALLSLLRLLKKRQHVLKVILGLAVFSAGLMAVLYSPTTIDRVYYGTDTRLFTILAGCVLAFIWPYHYLQDDLNGRSRRIFDSVGGAALLGLIVLAFSLNEYQNFLYYGGFVLVALLTVVLLAIIVHPSSRLAVYFSHDYLNWIGKRSYSIYLWHYPIIALTTPIKLIGRFNPFLFVAQLGLTLVIANVSYFWLEDPIRRFGIKKFFQKVTQLNRSNLRQLLFSFGVICTLSLSLWGVVEAINYKSLQATKAAKISQIKPVEKPKAKEPSEKPVKKKPITDILAIGDSIILGIEEPLQEVFPGVVVNGKVGRQLVDAQELVEDKYMKYNHKEALIIVELGSNSPFRESDLTEFLELFNDANILIINTRVPRNWEKEVNNLLAEAVKNHPNTQLADWYSIAIDDPGLLTDDGVHLSEAGVTAYMQMLNDKVEIFEIKAPAAD